MKTGEPDLSDNIIPKLEAEIGKLRQSLSCAQKAIHDYRQMLDDAQSVIVKYNSGGTITYFNKQAESVFGYSSEEVLGKHLIGIILPNNKNSKDYLSRFFDSMKTSQNKYANTENEIFTKQGLSKWIAWSNKQLFGNSGQATEILSIGIDITRRRDSELKLLESEHSLKRTHEIAKLGSLEWNSSSGYAVCSEQWHRIHGIEFKAGGTIKIKDIFKQIHPDFISDVKKNDQISL